MIDRILWQRAHGNACFEIASWLGAMLKEESSTTGVENGRHGDPPETVLQQPA